MAVPKYDEFFNPLLQALHELGSSASISELEERVANIAGLSEKDLEEPHDDSRTKFAYNLAWARTYLKSYGLVDNSQRGVWALTPEGQKRMSVDKDVVKRKVREDDRKKRRENKSEGSEEEPLDLGWQTEVLEAVKSMEAEAFERLWMAAVVASWRDMNLFANGALDFKRFALATYGKQ